MSGYLPGDISRPAWPHFEDAPEAELEEERAAFADWRRRRSTDPVPGDDQDESEIVATALRVVRI